ncbi:pilin [Patescibacteria group bacterium]|nr:pilin [Patescibacteria group bacterium]
MPKNKKILLIITFCGILTLILVSPVLAQTSKVLTNPLDPSGKYVQPEVLIGRIISAVLGIVGSIALLMFIYGGFLWLTSGGSPEKIKKGKDVLVWAVIGLAIIFLSYTLVNFVISGLTGKTTGNSSGGSENNTTTGCCDAGVACFDNSTKSDCDYKSGTFLPGAQCTGNPPKCL